jgi:leucine dehydrogenase
MFPYASEDAALDDVLRLSRAMTFKNALASLALGGGKSVILGDPADPQAPDRLRAFGRCIEALGGAYWTAEDVGVNLDGVERIAETTAYVFGTRSGAAATGDPSAFTARGVFQGLRAAVQRRLGHDSLQGLTVAVQGVGSVGWELCRQLAEAGARLVVADAREAAAARAVQTLGAVLSTPERIHAAEADVFAPCALGGVLDGRTIPELKAKVVAGAANNPLGGEADGAALHARGVLYAPDFVVNAGGMMHASGEIFGRYDAAAVNRSIDGIFDTVLTICERAEQTGRRPEAVALELAQERLAA